MTTTLRRLLEDDEREPLPDDELDDQIWVALATAISTPADLRQYERPVAVYFASRMLQSDVDNGGFAQAAINVPEWFPLAADGYRALGKAAVADLILEVARRLPDNADAAAGFRSGEVEWEDYFKGHAFQVFDDAAQKSGDWHVDDARIAYVRANRAAFLLPLEVEARPTPVFMPAHDFMTLNARLVERLVFTRRFLCGAAEWVVRALRAYRNDDGGFGNALEPDLTVPSSQPIHTDMALTILLQADARDDALVASACEFLAECANDDGAVPFALGGADALPRAEHWNGAFAFEPSLHATSGLCAKLHALDAHHPWLDRATAWCLHEIAGQPAYSGHCILNVMALLEHLPDRARAEALWPHATSRLFEADYVMLETPVEGYALTPLWFAPRPDAPARALFDDAVIEAHLDDLIGRQQADGGWPISWTPPGPAAVVAWRGRWTLEALLVLRAYGRI